MLNFKIYASNFKKRSYIRKNIKISVIIYIEDQLLLNRSCYGIACFGRKWAKEQSSKLAQEYRDKIAKLETKQDDNERISALIEKYRKVEELDRLTINTLIECIEIGGTKTRDCKIKCVS